MTGWVCLLHWIPVSVVFGPSILEPRYPGWSDINYETRLEGAILKSKVKMPITFEQAALALEQYYSLVFLAKRLYLPVT